MFPLRIRDNESQSLKSRLGAWAAYELRARAMILRPELRPTWEHEYRFRAYRPPVRSLRFTHRSAGGEYDSEAIQYRSLDRQLWT